MKIRQIVIDIILISALVSIFIILIMPFLAQVQFDSAERLIDKYLWKDAEQKLELAAKIDPYNAQYPASLGEFLFTQSEYKHNKTQLLEKAEKYYERAAELNSRCAEYYTKLGQIGVSMFIEGQGSGGKGQGQGYIDKAFESFRKAIEDDPNGFNTAYAVGYSGLSLWKYLKEDERKVVIKRLKFSLKQKPWYSQYIYPQLLQQTQNSKLLEPY